MAVALFKWCLLLLPFATFSKPHAHPFYVGVVEINHNKASAALEVSCKLFAEDVEDILEKNYKGVYPLNDKTAQPKIDAVLKDYISKNLSLKANGQPQALQYVGFEIEAEAIYCYLEATGINEVKTLDVKTSLLYDFTPLQINIVHVLHNGARQSSKLDYPKTDLHFRF